MIAAIIAECNPPHTGHAHLISEVRRHFGADTCVLLLMSGNYVQRGDLAIMDRYKRAAGALTIGADLVLELPFPYSCETAQIYAGAATSILRRLNHIDVLCFGSECGSIDTLREITAYLSSPQFQSDVSALRAISPRKSYVQLRTDAIEKGISHDAAVQSTLPNNILAIEYLLALKSMDSSMETFTIPRIGSYHGDDCHTSGYMSAGAIRKEIINGRLDKIDKYISADFFRYLINDRADGLMPADLNHLSPVFLTQLRRDAARLDFSSYFDIDAALAAKMKAALNRVTDIPSFTALLKAKHLTDAHLRRALLNAYFGVTSSDVHTAPAFTRLLASNARGKKSLKYLKQHSSLPILSCPSDVRHLTDEDVRHAVEFADFADSVYFLSIPAPQSLADLYRLRPIVTE